MRNRHIDMTRFFSKTVFATGLCFLGAVAGLTASPAQAEQRKVVVELFTSQGCSSCPPADALLAELAKRDDIVALALHVDYWDYIGWSDIFAKPAHSQRQKAYAIAADRRSVYTPQMIIDGSEHVVGNHPMNVADLVRAHSERPRAVRVRLDRVDADSVRIHVQPQGQVPGPMIVQLVRYVPQQTVDIKRGENAGKTLSYANIVNAWQVLAEWDGRAALQIDAKTPGPEPVVVVVQRAGPGRIEAAARLR